MIDISLQSHPDLYVDFRKGIEFLSKIKDEDFNYPDEAWLPTGLYKKIPFHVYSEVKTDKELYCIKSFFATQNLNHTQLVLWSDYDISNISWLAPYKEHIDFRVFNREELVKGTPLEGHPEWGGKSLNIDENHWMSSGLLRFLATYHEGGIWSDMDVIFLRNFLPILDQEWAYQWGSERDFYNFGPCAAIMSIHAGSEHSNMCLEEIAKTPCSGGVCLDHSLLAKVYRRRPFTIFPSTFFNTEWLINQTDRAFRSLIGHGFDTVNSKEDFLFEDVFAWHWHNSSNKDRPIMVGSKFNLLMERTDKLLKERGIL